MSSIGKLMKQASRIQRQMEETQQQLALRTVEASSGGGAVKVVARCDGSVASLRIDPQAVNPAETALLEDLVLSAVNTALTQARETASAEMAKLTGGMNFPGLGWPFAALRRASHGVVAGTFGGVNGRAGDAAWRRAANG